MLELNAPLDCRAAMRQLWDYLDEALTEPQMLAVRAHLLFCGECYGHYDFSRHFLDVLEAQMQAECAPSALHARVREALRVEGFAPKYDEW
jgi:mycothiol system anti-sigma-R factor